MRRRRIVVVPEGVEVVIPSEDSAEDLHAFLCRHRRWIYDRRQEMAELLGDLPGLSPDRLATGAKIPYRGRRISLRVIRREEETPVVEYRGGFLVHAPHGCCDAAIGRALAEWLKDRAGRDVRTMVRYYRTRLGVLPSSVRIGESAKFWGSCGMNGGLFIDWRLIFAPRPVLEYAVVHELCHIRYRNHSPEFWGLLRGALPDFEVRREWLNRHGRGLEAVRLGK